MKKLIFILSLGLMFGVAHINKIEAQQVRVSINIDVQPAWGPSGYNYAEFYYIPELNIYFDVINRLFYYPVRGRWVSTLFLPVAYSSYDFYSLYKVVLNGIPQPWRYNRSHARLYTNYRYNYAQIPIYYMREPYYRRARANYFGWVESRYMPRNEGRPVSRNFEANTRNGRISNEMRPSPPNNNRNEAVRNRSNNNNRSNNEAVRNNNNANRNNNNATVNTPPNRNNNNASVNNNSNSNTRSGNNSSSRATNENRPERAQNNRSTGRR